MLVSDTSCNQLIVLSAKVQNQNFLHNYLLPVYVLILPLFRILVDKKVGWLSEKLNRKKMKMVFTFLDKKRGNRYNRGYFCGNLKMFFIFTKRHEYKIYL